MAPKKGKDEPAAAAPVSSDSTGLPLFSEEALAAEALAGSDAAVPAPEDESLSGECGECFPILAALRGHRRKHGDGDPYKHFVGADGVCPVCRQCYWSRYRAVTHLNKGVL